MIFEYKVRTPQGEAQTGRLEANSEAEAREALFGRNLSVISLREVSAGIGDMNVSRPIGAAQIALMARQLQSLSKAGLPFTNALASVARSSRDDRIRSTLNAMRDDVLGGTAISAAAAKHPHVFNGFFVGMLEAGEKTGNLQEILGRVADQLERTAEVQRRVGQSLVYPSFVLAAGVALLIAMMVFIVPQFAEVVIDLDVELPAQTRLVLGVSEWLQSYGIILGLVLVAGIVALVMWARTTAGRKSVTNFLLKLPLFGNLLRFQMSGMFASSLAFASESGLDIMQALTVAESSAPNPVAAERIQAIRDTLPGGVPVAEAISMNSQDVFDPLLVDMASSGMESGNLEQLLHHAAEYFDKNVETASEALLKAVEPTLIIVVGVAAGGVVFSLFSPLVTLTQSVGGF